MFGKRRVNYDFDKSTEQDSWNYFFACISHVSDLIHALRLKKRQSWNPEK